MTLALKHAKVATRSITKRRISIGVVGRIKANMEVKCGGAVVSKAENSLAADSANTSLRMTKMMIWRMSRIKRKIRARSMCAAHVAKKSATRSKTVPEIPTSKLE